MSDSTPVCKLDLYRQLNLPLPNIGLGGQNEIQEYGQRGPVRCNRAMGGNEGPICKRDILKQMGLPVPGEDAGDIEIAVASMEQEVRAMQLELSSVQAERRQLEMQKRLLHCAAPAIAENACKGMKDLPTLKLHHTETPGIFPEAPKEKAPVKVEETELKNLEEEYDSLLKNFNTKVEEISSLRLELNEARRLSCASLKKMEQSEARAEDLEERLKAFEDEEIMDATNQERMIEVMQQLAMAERMFEKSFEEHEDLQRKVTTQTWETDEFRRKYLDTEQCAEEQRHKIEILDSERIRFGEEVTTELHKIKTQFQSKLEELTLLPDLIKKTNEKLKEIEDVKTTAEKNCVILSMSLDDTNEEKEAFQEQLEMVNRNKNESEAEKSSMKSFQTDVEKKMEETKTENKQLNQAYCCSFRRNYYI
ncbi:tropomyosin alpha-3 chain isoform X2 [Halyomorpha halys]|uniref:tropomyosin alpha-3 chain isoform X2 n=1 Tax=Halyomorpha halys TaxID=286706 RepID=UPI000D0C87D4|nr:outer dense fiber protein 2-like isoform X2 [Halyomorpha halys]